MRIPLATILALLALVLLAGCGGDDGDEVSSSTDVDQLLQDTFSGDERMKSGRIDLRMTVDVQGGDVQGPVNLQLSGPFQSEDEGRLPQLAIDASFEGAGESFQAGITSTGDRGFVSFQNTDYEISGPVFQQFKASYEQAAKQSQDKDAQSLAALGVDPRNWLTDARNAGEADVGGTETIKITGGVDVPRLLDDIDQALKRARSLGLEGASDLPEQLTDEQKQQAADAVRDLNVEIYTGKEDTLLRRMVVAFGIEAPETADTGGTESADIRVDLTFTEVNEDQEIEAPSDPRPFEDLVGNLQGLGLGGLGGGAGGDAGGGGAGGGEGASQQSLQEYTQCIQDAGEDTKAAQECAQLLTP